MVIKIILRPGITGSDKTSNSPWCYTVAVQTHTTLYQTTQKQKLKTAVLKMAISIQSIMTVKYAKIFAQSCLIRNSCYACNMLLG